jgi:glycosyltransferase involved in cell wall biosynthesis
VDVSVVIPTYARETRLAFALEALAAQTLERERFEVIVVRPPGASGPFAPAPEGLDVRFEQGPLASRPAQRNHGWRLASGGLIAFTDDDCRPHPRWLESLLDAANGPLRVVQGRTDPDPDEAHLLHGLARSVRVERQSPWYETCNIAYPRDLLERIGGFDERFTGLGEDTDLGLRAVRAGAEVEFSEQALVHHAVEPQPLGAAIRSGLTKWETTPLVYREHPEHRRHLFAGIFFNRTHAAVCAALAGLALRRRRPLLAALLIAPFVSESIDRQNVGPRGLARQLLHLPARFLRELAMVAGIVRGAVRHRSPMV